MKHRVSTKSASRSRVVVYLPQTVSNSIAAFDVFQLKMPLVSSWWFTCRKQNRIILWESERLTLFN